MVSNKMSKIITLLLSLLVLTSQTDFCENSVDFECGQRKSVYSNIRYILYDVNKPEGFNLRRDVYVRVATFINHLVKTQKDYKWQLVLPPWDQLYHWQSNDVGSQSSMPWKMFFDLESLGYFIPVIEFHTFLEDKENIPLDIVYFLQNDEEMFKTGEFKDKVDIQSCNEENIPYKKSSNGFEGHFYGVKNVSAHDVKCVSFHGSTQNLKKLLNPSYKSIMFDHMEIALHDHYGSAEYWTARRSMRYNSELHEEADEFRKKFLNSTNLNDNIKKSSDWRMDKNSDRKAVGGPYLAVHLRRKDFLYGHPISTPSLKSVASQISDALKKLGLRNVFIASDAPEDEFEILVNYLKNYTVHRYRPSKENKLRFKDGGVAIIDQIICSHARHFIGSHESTFTFRIQEDREILGFPVDTTFNRLCANKECSASRWQIIWG